MEEIGTVLRLKSRYVEEKHSYAATHAGCGLYCDSVLRSLRKPWQDGTIKSGGQVSISLWSIVMLDLLMQSRHQPVPDVCLYTNTQKLAQ